MKPFVFVLGGAALGAVLVPIAGPWGAAAGVASGLVLAGIRVAELRWVKDPDEAKRWKRVGREVAKALGGTHQRRNERVIATMSGHPVVLERDGSSIRIRVGGVPQEAGAPESATTRLVPLGDSDTIVRETRDLVAEAREAIRKAEARRQFGDGGQLSVAGRDTEEGRVTIATKGQLSGGDE